MPFNRVLRPEASVQIGVLTGVVDLFIYHKALPPMADIRRADPHNHDIEQVRRQAAWTSIAFNSFVSLITRDWNVFLIGGIVVAGIDLMFKHSNGVNPLTGTLSAPNEASTPQSMSNQYPVPDYSMADDTAA